MTEEDKWFDIHRTGIAWVDGRNVQLVTLYDITQKSVISSALRTRPIMIS